MSALVQGFAYFQLLHGIFPGRLSRLQDMSWCPALLLPCPQIQGLTASLFPSAWTCRFQVPLGGDSQAPGKWAVPRCGRRGSGSPKCWPLQSRRQHAWAAVVTPLARGCSRACAAGGCAGVSPPPRHRKPRLGVPEGWGCRTEPAPLRGCGRPWGPGGASESRRRRVGFPGLACVSPQRFTFSSHSTHLPR